MVLIRPHICHFLYTNVLFGLNFSPHESAWIVAKSPKISQNFPIFLQNFSAPSALTVSKCENSSLKFDSLILITHFSSSWGVSKFFDDSPYQFLKLPHKPNFRDNNDGISSLDFVCHSHFNHNFEYYETKAVKRMCATIFPIETVKVPWFQYRICNLIPAMNTP